MRIGVTYDLRADYLAKGMSEEDTAEFDSEITIAATPDYMIENQELDPGLFPFGDQERAQSTKTNGRARDPGCSRHRRSGG